MVRISDPSRSGNFISLRNALIIAICTIFFTAANSVLLQGNPELRTAISDVSTALLDLLATFGLIYGAYHSKIFEGHVRLAWTVFAAAQSTFEDKVDPRLSMYDGRLSQVERILTSKISLGNNAAKQIGYPQFGIEDA